MLQQHVGRVDVIENQTVAIPGSINTYDLRAQDPHGAFGQPMLSLVSGHYPAGPGQVAVTEGVATTFNLRIGDSWHQGGQVRQVTGIVQNPQSLLDEFALVAPGQVSKPSQVTVLFTAPPGTNPASLGSVSQYVVTRHDAVASNPLNPETIVLALATVGMLLIALVAVGGFTVLAQRRLRSLGMLGALGATDRNIRLVVRVNGVLVGVVGALAGTILGLAVWLAYRPRLESSAHHVIGAFQLPWIVIGPAMALAVVATYFAASRPARSITRIPIVAALSGQARSAQAGAPLRDPRRGPVRGRRGAVLVHRQEQQRRRSAGTRRRLRRARRRGDPAGALQPGDPGQSRAAGPDRGAPGPARPGPLPGPLGLGPGGHQPRRADRRPGLRPDRAAVRERPGLRRAEPGLEPDHRVHAQRPGRRRPRRGPGGGGPGTEPADKAPSGTASTPQAQAAVAQNIAKALGSNTVIELDQAGANLNHAAAGRSWSGPIYVATPQLLQAFGIKASDVNPDADILTARPGLSGISQMQLLYGDKGQGQGGQGNGPNGNGPPTSWPCPKGQCLANPVIQEVGAPSGRHVGPQHRDHRARHPHARPAAPARKAGSSRPRTRRPPRRSPTPGSPPARPA